MKPTRLLAQVNAVRLDWGVAMIAVGIEPPAFAALLGCGFPLFWPALGLVRLTAVFLAT